MRILLALCLTLCLITPSRAADAPLKFDWKTIPTSKVNETVEAQAKKLAPALKDLAVLFTPVQNYPMGKYSAWDLEGYIGGLMKDELEKEGVKFVDATEFAKKMEPTGKKVEPFVFSQPVIKGAAELTKATAVVTAISQISAGGAKFQFSVYDAGGSKRLAQAEFTLSAADILPVTNTPAPNRKVVGWAESQMGKKIDRGECTDLATEALKQIGYSARDYKWGRELPKGTTPLPGDIIQLENAQFGAQTVAHHTAMVWEVIGPRNVKVLEQNWLGGKEEGRKVGPGSYDFNKMTAGELHLFRPISSN